MILGQGYLVGMAATTLMLYLWGTVGLPLQFWLLAAIQAGICLFLYITIRRKNFPPRESTPQTPLELWQRLVFGLLLGLIALRYATIFQEIMLRPLFVWDAWMNWAPKAVIWFELDEFVRFVSPRDWLTQPSSAQAYTLGSWGAWRYPLAVPLIQLWTMLGSGVSDYNLVYTPWLLAPMALGLSLFGYLRLAGRMTLTALAGCYLLINLPYLNVHTALAGYADIWITAAFGCAIFALQEWERHGDRSQAAIALMLALFCAFMKIPGLIFACFIVSTFGFLILGLNKRPRIYLVVIAGLIFSLSLLVGYELAIPGLGNVKVSYEGISLPYVGDFAFSYHAVHQAVFTTMFLMINWNLLWYLVLVSFGCYLIKHKNIDARASLLLPLGMSLTFILFVYYFTERYKYALDYTQINRALIYLAPALVMLAISVLGQSSSATRGRARKAGFG